MNKSLLKKCLQIIDKIESKNMNKDTFYTSFMEIASKENILLSNDEVMELFQALTRTHNLIQYKNSFDLSQPLSLFSKSKHHSNLEALSLFEAMIQNTNEFILSKVDSYFKPILDETILFINNDLNSSLIDDLKWILLDKTMNYNCSYACKTYYTKELYSHSKLQFKNEHVKIINYPNIKRMKKIYDVSGIPVDRDCSKDLQSFFKDCLFNEFKHSCCLCQINLPQMLIASHIKPFRDCGYLVEAMDSNNGLLLCRNHDYLFDQGFIGFDENGELLISSKIKNDQALYSLPHHFKLNSKTLTYTRKLFLKYHKEHIFQE